MTTYYVDSRATGANDGDPDGATGPDSNGIYQDAFQSIADISGINNAGHTLIFVAGSGPYRLNGTTWAGEANSLTIQGNFCKISGGKDLNGDSAGGKWFQSAKTGEWYWATPDGGDPSLATVQCGVYDGHFFEVNEEELEYELGTPGSLRANQMGWGENAADSLGFNTVYVNSAVNPSSKQVDVAQVDYVFNTPYLGQSCDALIFEPANISCVRERNATGADCVYTRCIGKYAVGNAFVSEGNGGNVLHSACLSYYTHRLLAQAGSNSNGAIEYYNCIGLKGHLLGIVNGTSLTAKSVTVKNCIGFLQSNGTFDVNDANCTFTEDYNCLWPALNGKTTNALGYTHTSQWSATGDNSFPPAAATTIGTVAALESAGGVDPVLLANGKRIDATTIKTLTDDDLIAIVLAADSPVRHHGVNWMAGVEYLGIDGNPFPRTHISMGPVQSRFAFADPRNM